MTGQWLRAPVAFLAMLVGASACGSADPAATAIAVNPTVVTVATPLPTAVGPAPTSGPSATPAPTPGPTSTARPTSTATPEPTAVAVVPGLGQLVAADFAPLVGKRVGVIANATSTFDGTHIIDLLTATPDIDLVAAFAPEHGIRGAADAGARVADETDPVSGIPIFSLYGADRAPTAASLAEIDVLVYDLQDVGTRYYTYISTLGLAMQAAAAADVSVVVLDRPNPLGGDRVAGFTRTPDLESFVGQYPVPSVYGFTAGELATAIVGEAWLPNLDAIDLVIVPMANWQRSNSWDDTGLTWTPPSPGLPHPSSAIAYPATVLFEATTLSYGKGTDRPFEVIGAPWLDGAALASDLNARELDGVEFDPTTFTPTAGAAPNPRYLDSPVSGVALRVTDASRFDPVGAGVHLLDAVLGQAAAAGVEPVIDRPDFFDLLAGSPALRTSLVARETPESIIGAWTADRKAFETIHERYRRY